jgi:hypothetical protein
MISGGKNFGTHDGRPENFRNLFMGKGVLFLRHLVKGGAHLLLFRVHAQFRFTSRAVINASTTTWAMPAAGP